MDNSAQDDLMRYLDNEMDSVQHAAFEQKLDADKELFSEAESLALARRAVNTYGAVNQVSQIHKEELSAMKNAAPVIKMTPYRKIIRYSIAAAASLILIFFAAEYFNEPAALGDQLYAQAYTRFEPSAMRGATADTAVIAKEFLEHNNTAVINTYREEAIHTPDHMLIAAISYLESNLTPEAVSILKALAEKNTQTTLPAFNDEANYYLALALLKNRNYSEAATLMEKINADKDNPYSSKFPASYTDRVKKLQIQ